MSLTSTELQEVIRKNLPEMVAVELKEFIDTANKNARRLEQAEEGLRAKERRIDELERRVNLHAELDVRIRAVAEREARAEKTEVELAHVKANLIAEVARAELQGVKETLNAFLRNVTVRSSVTSSVPVPVGHTPSNPGYGGTGNPAHVQIHSATEVREEHKE